jgi:hypothetical protein
MKKPSLLILNSIIIALILVLAGCGEDIPAGMFYLSDEARDYQFDTVNSFKMIDNHGITEQFYALDYSFYTKHHFFAQFGPALCETFGITYNSVLNDYYFSYMLRAETDYSGLRVDWNQKDWLTYNFDEDIITSTGIMPAIKFYDTLLVGGYIYNHIIEVDYTGNEHDIDEDTPVKTYISGEKGLIKFTRKDGVIMERIPE